MPSVSPADLAPVIASIHAALRLLQQGKVGEPTADLTPAVPVRKSITPEYLICLEDGKKYKRHLETHFGLTPDQYRKKWNLPPDYPMTAPS